MLQTFEESKPRLDRTRIAERVSEQKADSRFIDAVHALAGIERAVVELTDIAGLSARAVADVLGIGKAQAQIALMRARRAVREQLVQNDAIDRALVTART